MQHTGRGDDRLCRRQRSAVATKPRELLLTASADDQLERIGHRQVERRLFAGCKRDEALTLAQARLLRRQAVTDGWFVDETYVKCPASALCVYRAVDDAAQVIDVFVPKRQTTSGTVSMCATRWP